LNWRLKDFCNLQIRNISINDSLPLLTLRNNLSDLIHYRNNRVVSREEHFEWMQNRLMNFAELTLVGLQDDVIGICYLTPNTLDPLSAEISIRIAPKFQGMGFGKQILTEMIEVGKKNNFNAILADIHNKNLTSQAFFSSFGFEPFGNNHIDFDKFVKYLR
jgi:L-amino acid N-acyltransferase YncA